MIQQFYNRTEELLFLEKQFAMQTSSLVVLYGRRRVGKTELIKKFLSTKEGIYYLFDEQREFVNIAGLQKKIADFFSNSLLEKAELSNWYDLFAAFVGLKGKKKLVLALDEFPYLMKQNDAIPSIFQKIWDELLREANIMLILCGSSISMMEKNVLSEKSPLYGRRTGQWKVEPFTFLESQVLLKAKNSEDAVCAYALFDGIPLYLDKYDRNKSIATNVEESIAKKGEYLYEEAEFLLRQEFREPANYFLILKAISFGKTKFGDIVNYTKLDKTLCSKYLDNLIIIKVIEKKHPVTTKKENTRDARYYITDNYLKFWFSQIYPNKMFIEEGTFSFSVIKEQFSKHVSFVFEEVARQILKQTYFAYHMGSWWDKNDEIDIVGISQDRKILFGEVKWQEKVNGEKIIDLLKEKAQKVDWLKDEREETYLVVAKSFSRKVKGCYDFDDIDKMMKK
jgi:AAA+ ATPase superfamily predicted ATPase